MTSNIGIMQITSQFEPFDNIMQPQTTFWTKHDFSKMIFKSGDNCIYGNPLGSNTHILTQFTINIGVFFPHFPSILYISKFGQKVI